MPLVTIVAGGVLLLIIAGATGYLLTRHSGKPQATVIVNTQSLDNGTLNRLTTQAGGSPKQLLTITPETTFKDSVNVQGAGTIQQNLTVGGSATVQGQVHMNDSLNVAKSLSVAGGGTFGGNLSVTGQVTAASLSVGSLTLSSVNLSGNIVFSGHIVPNGTAPAIRPSTAAGSGGTTTLSGNDTAGTVTITTGTSPVAGEMAIITFHTPFNTTPKVQLTPINDASSKLNYYATRSATFFTVDTSSAPAAGTQYTFDYLVTQ